MEGRQLSFDVTLRSVLKVIVGVICVWAWLQLWQFAMAATVSVFVAIAVEPVARRLEIRRFPRWLAALTPVLLIVLVIGGFIVAAWSSVGKEGSEIGPRLSKLEESVRSIPILGELLGGNVGTKAAPLIRRYGSAVGESALRALLLVVVGLILTIYLLIEREKTFEWLIAFVPREHRLKARQTTSRAHEVILGYVTGSMTTALFATIFVFTALTLLRVPAALPLALLAGIFDFVPVLGFVLSAAPAVMLALTESTTTGILVLVLYISYHVVEAYFIVPRVYAGRLRLSNVAILVAFAVGAELGGAIGAILALPLAAIYPAVERIWLGEYLGRDVVQEHQRQEAKTSP